MTDFYRPDIQTLPREALRALQGERLRSLVHRVFEQPVPFFKGKLEAAGLGPDDVKTLDDLTAVPLTVKQDLRDSEAEHPPLGDYRGAPLERCVRLSTTTGTSGQPTIILFTPHDLEVEYDAAGRMFTRQGYRPGMVITQAHPGGVNGGQALFGGAIEHFGCLNVPVGPPMSAEDAQRAISLWRQLKPDHYEMFGPPRHIFWDTAHGMGLDPPRDLNFPPPEDVPQWRTLSAGIDCFAFLGSACDEQDGAHICEDEAIVEAVDPATGDRVPDGERGHLVVTSLTKDNFMLRYDLEDLVRVDASPCTCGETHARGFWDGRAKDLVPVGDQAFLPVDVGTVLREFEEVSRPALEFQLVRTSDTSRLRIRVEAQKPSDELGRRLAAAVEERLGAPAEVQVLQSGELPRPFYKPMPVVDE